MGKQSLLEKIKYVVFVIVSPIYLWSIGMKTMEDYISEIERQYMAGNGE